MSKPYVWHDDYWLMLMQLYLRRPVGVKPMYSRPMVELCLELHIPPVVLFARMCSIANADTPRMERLWRTYGSNPRKLSRAVALLRAMSGFNSSGHFYDGVETNETFECDFRPVADGLPVTPVMLILILDLYFRLTPITMVPDTPEIVELSRLIGLRPSDVSDIMDVYQHCDPYLNRADVVFSPYLLPCQQIWKRFGNSSCEALASYASQLKEYFY
ncbi:MAG: hypothetical protein J6B91_07525 [Prevotella sp.]|nr:hypothetical protein [Prevotella sp.]